MSSSSFSDAQQRLLRRYDVRAESRYVEAPACHGRAHVLVCGEGPPVVLLNGIGTPAAMWAPLIARLHGVRCHGIDLPGYGLTDTADSFFDDYRGNAVAFLEQVLDGLGLGPTVFLANSLGSLWTFWFALEQPSRVTAAVHVGCPALVLDSSAPLPMRMLSVPVLSRLLDRAEPPSARQVQRLAQMVHEDPLVPEVADVLLATEQRDGFAATFLPTLRTLLRLRGPRPAMRLTADQLGRITHPVRLVWGADDPFGSPAVGRRTATALPDAELHVVPGGHAPWLGQAERVASVAAPFLREQAVLW